MRRFPTGATRDDDKEKLDYEGFLSPLVLRRYAQYMHAHRIQADGTLRASDNWQKGIPLDAYMKSAWRHFMDWWMAHRGHETEGGMESALCALIFNAMGYLHELLKGNLPVRTQTGKPNKRARLNNHYARLNNRSQTTKTRRKK